LVCATHDASSAIAAVAAVTAVTAVVAVAAVAGMRVDDFIVQFLMLFFGIVSFEAVF
jgi:hypothetical protein